MGLQTLRVRLLRKILTLKQDKYSNTVFHCVCVCVFMRVCVYACMFVCVCACVCAAPRQ